MKFSAQEEYGLRCLLRMGRTEGASVTIPEIAEAERLSVPYVAKIMRVLRQGGFVKSVRGQSGGYVLARSPEHINVGELLAVLGGRLIEDDFCEKHSGSVDVCTHSVDCSIRSLWSAVQVMVDKVLSHTTLKDLLANEEDTAASVDRLIPVSTLTGQNG